LNFLERFSKNPEISNFIIFHPVGARLVHADRWMDGQTDMMNLIAPVCSFADMPKTAFLQ
jgi:hypothetical protein